VWCFAKVYLRVSVFLILVQEQLRLYVSFYTHFYEHQDPNSLSIYWNEKLFEIKDFLVRKLKRILSPVSFFATKSY